MTTPVSNISPLVRIDAYTGASGAGMPASAKMARLFDRIDASGSGAIDRKQFEAAFATLQPPRDFKARGADDIWVSLAPHPSGSISKQDFVAGMVAQMRLMRAGPR